MLMALEVLFIFIPGSKYDCLFHAGLTLSFRNERRQSQRRLRSESVLDLHKFEGKKKKKKNNTQI